MLEPDFASAMGHYASYVEIMRRGCEQRGWRLRVVADRRLPVDLVDRLRASGVDVAPRFHSDRIARVRARAATWPLWSAEMARVAVSELRRDDDEQVVVSLSGRLEYVAGAALASVVAARPLVYQVFWWEAGEATSTTPRTIRGYRRATEWASRHAQGFRLAAQTEPVASHVAAMVGCDVATFPMLIDWNDYPLLSPPNEPTVAYMGDARADKGFPLFVAAAMLLPSPVRVIAQAHFFHRHADPDVLAAREQLRTRPNTVVLDNLLSVSEYRALLASVDLVVLPYEPGFYAHRTSNVLAEAMGVGTPAVVTDGTWMSDMVRKTGGGTTFGRYEADSLADAIGAALEVRRELQANAAAVRDSWRASNQVSAALDAIVRLASLGGRRGTP
jgi:glycosyltransferase involved in cell wall biosynthesis